MTIHRDTTDGYRYRIALQHFWSAVRGNTPVSEILTDYRDAAPDTGAFYIDINNDVVTGGFIIKPGGELVGVFSALTGRGDQLVMAALNSGATHLDCFDGYLTEFYARHGFVEYDRQPNWTPGGPAVVYMGLRDWIERRTEWLRIAAEESNPNATKTLGELLDGLSWDELATAENGESSLAETMAKVTGSVGATVINERVTYDPDTGERVVTTESVETYGTFNGEALPVDDHGRHCPTCGQDV